MLTTQPETIYTWLLITPISSNVIFKLFESYAGFIIYSLTVLRFHSYGHIQRIVVNVSKREWRRLQRAHIGLITGYILSNV